MSVDQTIGNVTKRKVINEESYSLVKGFPYSGSLSSFFPNMMVKLNSDGTVSPVAAATDRTLGRVTSCYQGNDSGNIRVATPFESVVYAYSDAGIDEGQELSCTGFDATSGLPKYKTSTSGDWVSAVCLIAASDTVTTGIVGILRGPYKK